MLEGFLHQIERNPMVDPMRIEILERLGDVRDELIWRRDMYGEDITHGVEVAKVYERYVNDIGMSLRDMNREIAKVNEKYCGPGPHSMFDDL